jgi:dihydropteroate synthase type 2
LARPRIFGILNVTQDSFSDGGRFLSPADAARHAQTLLDAGADVLDIGAAASNPDAVAVTPSEEIARLQPLLAGIADVSRVSVDTLSVETQRWALDRGVGWLNDILGFPDPSFYPDLASSPARLVVMHNVAPRGRAERIDTDPATIFDRLFRFFDDRLVALETAGIARDRLVIDPGMGFFLGSDPEVSLTVLRGIDRLKQRYRLPVLISVSRKSFIRRLAGVEVAASGPATLAAELFAAAAGADFLRTHDVSALKQALDVWQALENRPKD